MSALDYTQEPEKIWKASLLKHQNETHFFLFVLSNYSKAWEIMIGWIGTLNDASQKKLSSHTKELEAAVFDREFLTPRRTYQIYRDLSSHVFNCYLSQGGFGMIQTSTLPISGGPKPPSNKAYDKVKATL